ncbi:MAG: hypothetical protein ACYCZN_04600 [Candidatus Dormibacteria bacterium]
MSDWQGGWDRQLETDRESARGALDQWSAFPTGDPRPLVLVGPTVWQVSGFSSGAAKLAYVRGDFQLPPSVPVAVLDVVRAALGTKVGLGSDGEPLRIRTASLSSAEFETDRRLSVLPAWRLDSDQANGPIWVLAPEVASTVWTPRRPERTSAAGPPPPKRVLHATVVGSDGRRLRVAFIGGSPGFVEYRSAEVLASDQAVVVVPVAHDIGPPEPRAAIGVRREVDADLDRPLGNRVLIDLDAGPVVVSGSQVGSPDL